MLPLLCCSIYGTVLGAELASCSRWHEAGCATGAPFVKQADASLGSLTLQSKLQEVGWGIYQFRA